MGCLLFYTLSLFCSLFISLPPPPDTLHSPVCCSRRFPLTRPVSLFAVLFFTFSPPSRLSAFRHLKRSSISFALFRLSHTYSRSSLPSVFLSFSFIFHLGTHSFPPTLDILSYDSKCLGPSRRRTHTYVHKALIKNRSLRLYNVLTPFPTMLCHTLSLL